MLLGNSASRLRIKKSRPTALGRRRLGSQARATPFWWSGRHVRLRQLTESSRSSRPVQKEPRIPGTSPGANPDIPRAFSRQEVVGCSIAKSPVCSSVNACISIKDGLPADSLATSEHDIGGGRPCAKLKWRDATKPRTLDARRSPPGT
jgi:hypothetical protein